MIRSRPESRGIPVFRLWIGVPPMDEDRGLARALEAASQSLARGEMPIGAALAINGRILGVTHNAIASQRSLIAHAEVLLLMRHGPALMTAFEQGRPTATIYTTLEPCLMCLSACAHARVSRVVFACRDPLAGAGRASPPGDWYRAAWPRLEHRPALEGESARMLLAYTEHRPGWEAFRKGLLRILETNG